LILLLSIKLIFEHIANTGHINGNLRVALYFIMTEYAKEISKPFSSRSPFLVKKIRKTKRNVQ